MTAPKPTVKETASVSNANIGGMATTNDKAAQDSPNKHQRRYVAGAFFSTSCLVGMYAINELSRRERALACSTNDSCDADYQPLCRPRNRGFKMKQFTKPTHINNVSQLICVFEYLYDHGYTHVVNLEFDRRILCAVARRYGIIIHNKYVLSDAILDKYGQNATSTTGKDKIGSQRHHQQHRQQRHRN